MGWCENGTLPKRILPITEIDNKLVLGYVSEKIAIVSEMAPYTFKSGAVICFRLEV